MEGKYLLNQYMTNARRPRHKARISIALLEKETKAIKRSNLTEGNEYIPMKNDIIKTYFDRKSYASAHTTKTSKKRKYYSY